MREERLEYIDIIKELDGDIEGRNLAASYIEQSDAWAYGHPVAFPYVPYLWNAIDMQFVKRDMRLMHSILCKVIRHFLDCPEYRLLFNFSPEAERLILLPCNYEQLLPMGRFDFFLDEQDFSYKFCEFNTDGSGAMSRDWLVGQALMQGQAFKKFAAQHTSVRQFELFDSWVQAFMQIYRTDLNAVECPNICVTDFRESGVFSDFNRFIEAFRRAGYNARFVDVREFEFDGQRLIDPNDGTQIHAIYRRAVTSEILQHPGECNAMIDAVEAQKVCLIGHFRTTVVHSKMVNIALFHQSTREFLTQEECEFIDAHVPRTFMLEANAPGFSLDDVFNNKDAWIIKPADDYGAHGVYPGVDFDSAQWQQLVHKSLDSGYIAQEYYPPHTVPVIETRIDKSNPCKVEEWLSMPGAYMYDGEPIGFYNRLGRQGVIALDHKGMCSNSFYVE